MQEQCFGGYVLSTVLKLLKPDVDKAHKMEKAHDMNEALALLNNLSVFNLDYQTTVKQETDSICAVYENIISRGLPTIPNLFIEETFSEIFNIGKKGEDPHRPGTIIFTDNDNNLSLLSDQINKSLFIIDPRISLNGEPKVFYDFSEISDGEKEFVFNTVPNHIGEYFVQLLEPQRYISSIQSRDPYSKNSFEKERANFDQQRIDFTVDLLSVGGKKSSIAIEIDDSSHQDSAQRLLDAKRDRFLAGVAGWQKTIRIPTENLNSLSTETINQFESFLSTPTINKLKKNYENPIWQEKYGLKSMEIALSPIAIARVQKAILKAIHIGILNLNQPVWNIAVVERDVPCAHLAVTDLVNTFEQLFLLEGRGRQLPDIDLKVFVTKEFKHSTLNKGKAIAPIETYSTEHDYDLTIDISMLQRSGVSYPYHQNIQTGNKTITVRSIHSVTNQRKVVSSEPIIYSVSEAQQNDSRLTYFLQNIFRKETFKIGQVDILRRTLTMQSVVALLPTGAGKSLTYQLSSLLQPGITIIVDPLKSLMRDQDRSLKKAGIDSTIFINSSLKSAQERKKLSEEMRDGQHQFIFISPERFQIQEFRDYLGEMKDSFFTYCVIDEAHCVSEWGHDFRTAYLKLGENARKYLKIHPNLKQIPLVGLTGTASFDVLEDVQRELFVDGDDYSIVRPLESARKELIFKIIEIPPIAIDKKAGTRLIEETVSKIKKKSILDVLRNLHKEKWDEKTINTGDDNFLEINSDFTNSGIIFCPHVNWVHGVVENAEFIKRNLPKLANSTGVFAGKLADENNQIDLEEAQDEFMKNKLNLLVATKAFGMGIDKPNVRFTVNMNYSSSLESFVQEAGRAGRDKKIALSTILFADYKLVRINSKFQATQFPLGIIKNKWFKEEDLHKILNHYNLSVDDEYFDYFTPHHDLVKLRCEVDNKKFAFGECNTCPQVSNCNLSKTPKEAKGFQYFKDLEEILKNNGLDFPKKDLEYVNADYQTVMFFYNNNFKGSLIEKQTMHKILSNSDAKYFLDDNEEIKANELETVTNFLQKLLSVEVGTEIVAFISYKGNYADYAKAIYRMCCIELIDDFTQDYSTQQFRIVTKRKADGDYYKGLEKFLMRYYSTERAEEEIKKVPEYKGENEIHKCLGYLTEFIYDKIAVKRKRAIDDMRTFCIQGINDTKDWKEVNEDLKDFIYYYFNSKYAQDDYETENGEPFSLTTDSDKGKISSFEILFKYLRVINEDVYGSSGSPKDSVKHLQGAVRLIRRSLTDNNPALAMLNAFCIAYLGTNNNEVLEQELENSYKEGYRDFYFNNSDKEVFYLDIKELKVKLNKSDISNEILDKMNDWITECELDIHTDWLNNFTKKYTEA